MTMKKQIENLVLFFLYKSSSVTKELTSTIKRNWTPSKNGAIMRRKRTMKGTALNLFILYPTPYPMDLL